jgi:hypothetical protein
MGDRYLVTGVQLGMLMSTISQKSREDLIREIMDKQYINKSDVNIILDCNKVSKILNNDK